ncbi:MAG TPA: hypothetical protein VMV69_08785 [Pirellulales bacterium]|nr:hypothetical protein [Pirellulales bacterium]
MWNAEGMGQPNGTELMSWATVKELLATVKDESGLASLFVALADMATATTNLRTGRKHGGVYTADQCLDIIRAAKRAGELVGGIISSDPTTALAQEALAFGFRTVANRATEAERLCRKRKPDWAAIAATCQAVGLTLMACEAFLCPFFAKFSESNVSQLSKGTR